MRKKNADKLVQLLKAIGIESTIYKVRRGYWTVTLKVGDMFVQLVEF